MYLFHVTIWISIERTFYTHEASGKQFNYVEIMQSNVANATGMY